MGPDLHCTDLVLPRGLVTSCVRDIRHVCHNDSVSPSPVSKVMMSPILSLSSNSFLFALHPIFLRLYSYCDAPETPRGSSIYEFGATIII